MDVVILIFVIYGIVKAVEASKKAFRQSKTSYMRSVDSRFPSLPKPQRAARAVQHDVGYWSAHALRGFPAARRGFAAGWQEARQAKADGKPVLWRDVTPPGAEDRPVAGEGSDFPVLLRARSKSGRKLNPLTGGPGDVATVYDAEDLQRRLDAAADDPDIEVTTEPLPPQEPAVDPHEACNAPGCGCGCHGTTEPESAGMAALQPAGTQTATEGIPTMAATADVTYNSEMDTLVKMRDESDEELIRAKAKLAAASVSVDSLIGMRAGAGTIGHAESRMEALKRQADAAQEALDEADASIASLKREHGGIQEAVDNSPVALPAEPEFYSA